MTQRRMNIGLSQVGSGRVAVHKPISWRSAAEVRYVQTARDERADRYDHYDRHDRSENAPGSGPQS
jgi:hypothetical protein